MYWKMWTQNIYPLRLPGKNHIQYPTYSHESNINIMKCQKHTHYCNVFCQHFGHSTIQLFSNHNLSETESVDDGSDNTVKVKLTNSSIKHHMNTHAEMGSRALCNLNLSTRWMWCSSHFTTTERAPGTH